MSKTLKCRDIFTNTAAIFISCHEWCLRQNKVLNWKDKTTYKSLYFCWFCFCILVGLCIMNIKPILTMSWLWHFCFWRLHFVFFFIEGKINIIIYLLLLTVSECSLKQWFFFGSGGPFPCHFPCFSFFFPKLKITKFSLMFVPEGASINHLHLELRGYTE